MKSNGIQYVVWDWNGTLLDDVQACIEAINLMLGKRNLPLLTPESYREFFGFPVRDYYVALGFDFAVEDWDALAREFHDHYRRTSESALLRDGAVEILDAIRTLGVPMSVLSASERSILRRMLRSRGIDRYFENVYGLDDLYAGSKLDLGHTLLRVAGVPPGSVLFVGDTLHDYEVARHMRRPCVLMSGGHQAEHRLARCGCTVLRHAGDLPRLVERWPAAAALTA